MKLRIVASLTGAAVMCAAVAACHPVEPRKAVPVVDYAELAARYNANIRGLDRLWSRSVVELRWKQAERSRLEQGEGHFLMIRPDRLALTVGKLGQTLFWLGCNGQRGWIFDLQSQPSVLYLYDSVQAVQADSLIAALLRAGGPACLLGLVELEPEIARVVTVQEGCWVLEPADVPMRLWIDPVRAVAVQVDLLDEEGRTLATAKLSRHEPVDLSPPAGFRPLLARRIEIVLADGQQRLTLFLSDVSAGLAETRIQDRAFDLEALIRALKPEKIVPVGRQTAEDVSQSSELTPADVPAEPAD